MWLADLRGRGVRPRVHGNGFLQLDLNETGTRRLHIWHMRLPRQAEATPIHDHVFNMRSTVLLGTLIHEELEATKDCDGEFTVYRAVQAPGTQNTTLEPDDGFVRIASVQRLVLGYGSVYTFPRGRLHQTDHVGLTATLMEKLDAPSDYGRPRVLVPFNTDPDNEFDREGFDPDALWPYVGYVNRAIDADAEFLIEAAMAA